MLHAYVERFDVMGGGENILGWDGISFSNRRFHSCPR
jgi:hypothetical protein